MNKLRLYIHYNVTDQPWGGINSFIRSFRDYIIQNREDIEIVKSINDNFDILFLAAASSGQGQHIKVKQIEKIIKQKKSFWRKRNDFKIIHRLDGLRAVYAEKFIPNDKTQIELSQLADFIIFQSVHSLETFKLFGFNGDNYTIINNGVNQNVFNLENKTFYNGGKIKILSASWSHGLNKGFETIAKFSECPDAEVCFIGNWNPDVDKRNVKIIPPLKQAELASFYKSFNVFLHAAKNDPCPNVVLEAMSCGLPTLYNNSGGTAEIAKNYGIAIPDQLDKDSVEQTINIIKDSYNLYANRLIQDHNKFSIDTVAENYIRVFNSIKNE